MAQPPTTANDDLYRDLVEHSHDLLCTHDLQGKLLSVNPAPARILGYEVDELLKIPMRQLIAPEFRDQFDAYLGKVQKMGWAEGILVLMTRSGERRFWQYRNTLRTEGLAAPIVRGMAHDITERKRAEALLRQEREFLEAVLDNMAEGIVACDADGNISRFNRASQEMYGKPSQRVPPDQWAEAFGIYLADGKTLAKPEQVPLYRAWKGERFRDEEITLIPKEGDLRSVLVSGQPLIGIRGRQIGAVIAMHDITERKRLQEQLEQSARLEATGVLAGGLAHDFNNILGVILGYAELMQRDLPETSPLVRHAAGIKRSAEAAAALTRQLLAFSRKQLLQVKVVDLNQLVNHFSSMLQPVIQDRIQLSLDLTPDLAQVRVDPLQVEQVLMNLALNARDAMPGSGRLLISTAHAVASEIRLPTGVAPGKYAVISVSDDGLGMEEEVLSHIFEPFFTTKTMGKGTGLGLAITYGIVKQSGGYITVQSKVGQGTTFSIYFPVIQEPAKAEISKPVSSRLSNDVPTILIVEDEPALSEMLCAVLEVNGYEVLLAASPDDALEIAQHHEHPIHLMITDVVLRSNLDGLQLVDRFRALRPWTKMMLMSGYSSSLLAGTREDCPPILEKPFSAEQLLQCVRQRLTES